MEQERRAPGEERRHRRRRDDDVARDEIVEHAVHDAPIVHKIVQASERVTRIGGAGLLIGGFIGALLTGIGVKIIWPTDAQAQVMNRVNSNTARIDSIVNVLRDVTYNLRIDAYARCLQSHREQPDECKP